MLILLLDRIFEAGRYIIAYECIWTSGPCLCHIIKILPRTHWLPYYLNPWILRESSCRLSKMLRFANIGGGGTLRRMITLNAGHLTLPGRPGAIGFRHVSAFHALHQTSSNNCKVFATWFSSSHQSLPRRRSCTTTVMSH